MDKTPLLEGSYKLAFDARREKLKQVLPEKIEKLALCKYNSNSQCFSLESFGQVIDITYPNGKVYLVGVNPIHSIDWALIILNYLLSAKNLPLDNEWITYRDLPSGNLFFPSIKQYVLETLSNFFSTCDRLTFSNNLLNLGFEIIKDRSDLAAIGYFTSRVPILIKFWEGDDEIPSSCQILFDKTISNHMHVEDIAALCSVLRELIIN